MDISLFEEYCEIVFANIMAIFTLCSFITLACKCIYFQVKETLRKENKKNER